MSKTEHKRRKTAKPRRKVKLPVDRTGEPINVGDVIRWDNGQRIQVATLTYYGEDYERYGRWTAEDEDGEFSDNLGGSLIVWRARS